MFDAVLEYRNGRWEWSVYDRQGNAILQGSESTHAEARYQSGCGLLLLKTVANRTRRFSDRGQAVARKAEGDGLMAARVAAANILLRQARQYMTHDPCGHRIEQSHYPIFRLLVSSSNV